jgi:hypothetical protein
VEVKKWLNILAIPERRFTIIEDLHIRHQVNDGCIVDLSILSPIESIIYWYGSYLEIGRIKVYHGDGRGEHHAPEEEEGTCDPSGHPIDGVV